MGKINSKAKGKNGELEFSHECEKYGLMGVHRTAQTNGKLEQSLADCEGLDGIHIEVKRPKFEKIKSKGKEESSSSIRERVNKARNIQIERYKKYHIYSNSEVNSRMIAEFCRLDSKGEELLQNAFLKFKLSVRAYEKILKVARTIADLEGKENIEFNHVAEAIQYRSLDRYNAIEEGSKK